MKPFVAVVKKELKSVFKERTIMIAIGIQLFIASFSSVILVGLLSFYDPSSIVLNSNTNIRAGIYGDLDSVLVSFLQDAHIRPFFFSYPKDAERAFQLGSIDALLFIPEEAGSVENVKLFLPEAETRATVIMMILQQPFKQYENYLRNQHGIEVNFQDLQGKSTTTYEFLYATIIPILMFFPGFVAGSMVVDSISSEVEHNTLETLRSTTLSINQIFGAKIGAAFILALAQIVLWSILIQLNQIDLQNIPLVLLLAAIVASLNCVGAAFITTIFKDRERAQFIYSLTIVLVAATTYSIGFSPITLMTQLAAGDYYANLSNVANYLWILLIISVVYLIMGKRLMETKL